MGKGQKSKNQKFKELKISERYKDPTINIILDTLEKNKQSLVFVNTRRGAESQAEKISLKMHDNDLADIADKILNVLSSPTKQCKRLAKCVRRGSAFHHSGLHPKQRELVEDNFKKRKIKVICATPTLAAGVNMPAFRVVIRDLKRYAGRFGMQWIPVLEYEQMSGRCGRPGYDDHGETICVTSSDSEFEAVWEKYVEGEPEKILSKLAVEPVLRIYVLSLIASEFCTTRTSLYEFFDGTFYAYQYSNSYELRVIIDKMIDLLTEWEFLKGEVKDDFVSASDLDDKKDELEATLLGKRVSQLYLDPYTANYLIMGMRSAASQKHSEFSWLQMFSNTLEMRPPLRVKSSEFEMIRQDSLQYLDELFYPEPSEFEYEYDQFMNSVKTALFLNEWIQEKGEDYLMEKYDVRPGEIKVKLDLADWLLFSCQELAKLLKFHQLISEVGRLRARLKYGVKEELLPLLKLKNIGRVRARKMFKNGMKDIGDVKKVDNEKLARLIGPKNAINVKEQVGIKVKNIKVPPKKRKGQINLNDFR